MPIIVPPSGDPRSRIAIVGARPGRDEVAEGVPFVGYSGRLLWKLLPIARGETYVTNLRRDFSTENSVPTRSETLQALPILREELERTDANLLLALGKESFFALTGLESLEAWRGSILPSSLVPGKKVMGSWHPAGVLRKWSYSYILEHDLRRAVHEANYPEIRRPNRAFTLDPDLNTFTAYCNALGSEVSIDIETFGERIACVGLSDRSDRAICLPFIGGCLTRSELAHAWRVLDRTLSTRGIIGQNIQFDTTRLERYGFTMPNLVFDTMLAHHLLWPELDHDLGFIVSMYTDEPYYKHEGGWQGDFSKFWTYNCKDAACTFEAAASLKRELTQANQIDYYKEAVMGLIRPVMAMQSRGLCVDFDALNKTRNRLQLETKYLQLQLNKSVGFECNVRSSTDLRYLLHECLKLPKIKLSDKTGKPSADKDVLHQYAYASEDPRQRDIFQTILDVRERRTLTSSFFHLETNEDGRYTANFLIHGTHNGRLASRKGERPGPQLQNIPTAARSVFVASPGHLFGSGDLRRAEAMFVAYDAEEEALIDIFTDSKRDLYKEVAARSLDKRVSNVTKQERELFKRVVHASNYGMMYNKFVIVLRISGINIEDLNIEPITLDELVRMNPVYAKMSYDSARRSFNRLSEAARKAARILEGYHASYPKIRRWQHNIGEQTTRTRIIRDAFGRRISFLGRLDDKLVRDALSARPQGTVVGIANRALRLLYQQRSEGQIPADIVLQAHDSVMIEFPEKELEISMRALEDALTCELMVGGRKLVIPIDLAYGRSWGALDHAWRRAT